MAVMTGAERSFRSPSWRSLSPPPLRDGRPDRSPAYVANGLVGLRLPKIPLARQRQMIVMGHRDVTIPSLPRVHPRPKSSEGTELHPCPKAETLDAFATRSDARLLGDAPVGQPHDCR
jgi:hypothetical protein